MATNFGFANDFNVFVINDHTQSNVDSEGRVAVGGDATYTNYGVGSALTLSLTRADLIVGGNINITSGVNQNGNTIISPNGTVINYTMANANGVPNQPIVEFGVLLSIFLETNYLRCASAGWGVLAPNGTAEVEFGGLVLTGTDPNLNIFNINGTNIAGSGIPLSGLNQINIVAPIGSTILVNVSGGTVGFGGFQMYRNGVQATGDDGRYILAIMTVWKHCVRLNYMNHLGMFRLKCCNRLFI